MQIVLRLIGVLVLCAVALFAQFYLPSRDIVWISGTEVQRMDRESTDDRGNRVTVTRDVRLINAHWPDGGPRVYRNEDAGFLPPYFKWDSANLSARAERFVSTADDPRWVIVTHYGWRVPFFSMFPNAVSIEPAEGPDQRLFPWFNLFLMIGAVVLALVAWRFLVIGWRRLRGRPATG